MSEIQTNIDNTTAGSYYDNNQWYLQYNKDEFRGYTFRWGYKWSEESGQWIISDLTMHCPYDDTELIENRQFLNDHMECPRCKKAFTRQNTHEIMTLIKDNVRRLIEQYEAGN